MRSSAPRLLPSRGTALARATRSLTPDLRRWSLPTGPPNQGYTAPPSAASLAIANRWLRLVPVADRRHERGPRGLELGAARRAARVRKLVGGKGWGRSSLDWLRRARTSRTDMRMRPGRPCDDARASLVPRQTLSHVPCGADELLECGSVPRECRDARSRALSPGRHHVRSWPRPPRSPRLVLARAAGFVVPCGPRTAGGMFRRVSVIPSGRARRYTFLRMRRPDNGHRGPVPRGAGPPGVPLRRRRRAVRSDPEGASVMDCREPFDASRAPLW